jgi:hypothetical protein
LLRGREHHAHAVPARTTAGPGKLMNLFLPWVISMLFGVPPGTYRPHHVFMHHVVSGTPRHQEERELMQLARQQHRVIALVPSPLSGRQQGAQGPLVDRAVPAGQPAALSMVGKGRSEGKGKAPELHYLTITLVSFGAGIGSGTPSGRGWSCRCSASSMGAPAWRSRPGSAWRCSGPQCSWCGPSTQWAPSGCSWGPSSSPRSSSCLETGEVNGRSRQPWSLSYACRTDPLPSTQ